MLLIEGILFQSQALPGDNLSAIVLENLIGQFLYNKAADAGTKPAGAATAPAAAPADAGAASAPAAQQGAKQ